MRRLGIYSTSGDKHTRLRNQMKRLFYSQIVLVYKDAHGERFVNSPIADSGEFWWDAKHPDQASLWWCINGHPGQAKRKSRFCREDLTMWKRDEAVKPTSGQSTPTGSVVPSQGSKSASPPPDARQQIGRDVVHIGKSVVIKGELNGSEDLTIEGEVEGKIELKDHVLTDLPRVALRPLQRVCAAAGDPDPNVSSPARAGRRRPGRRSGRPHPPRARGLAVSWRRVPEGLGEAPGRGDPHLAGTGAPVDAGARPPGPAPYGPGARPEGTRRHDHDRGP